MADFEVEMRPGGIPGRPQVPDELAFRDVLSIRDDDEIEMGVEREVSVLVIDHDSISIIILLVPVVAMREACFCREDLGVERIVDVDGSVHVSQPGKELVLIMLVIVGARGYAADLVAIEALEDDAGDRPEEMDFLTVGIERDSGTTRQEHEGDEQLSHVPRIHFIFTEEGSIILAPEALSSPTPWD